MILPVECRATKELTRQRGCAKNERKNRFAEIYFQGSSSSCTQHASSASRLPFFLVVACAGSGLPRSPAQSGKVKAQATLVSFLVFFSTQFTDVFC